MFPSIDKICGSRWERELLAWCLADWLNPVHAMCPPVGEGQLKCTWTSHFSWGCIPREREKDWESREIQSYNYSNSKLIQITFESLWLKIIPQDRCGFTLTRLGFSPHKFMKKTLTFDHFSLWSRSSCIRITSFREKARETERRSSG